jgi:hypothetical protein
MTDLSRCEVIRARCAVAAIAAQLRRDEMKALAEFYGRPSPKLAATE